VVADVTGETLKDAIREVVDKRAYILTDEYGSYNGLDKEFAGHDSVCHSAKEWVRGDVNTNTVESSFALVKRGIVGIYHNVSKEYLHRYIWQFDFLWNNRGLSDGERISLVVKSSEGKRLRYKGPTVL
jgi:hypothetical protein